MEQSLRRVTIFGTGLIGGSLALALKRAFPGVRVAGVDKPDVAERALRLNIIDAAGAVPSEIYAGRRAGAYARNRESNWLNTASDDARRPRPSGRPDQPSSANHIHSSCRTNPGA